jgi:3-phenylpropionate/trans-cinnamate dioxygenase ferredoxin component
MSDTWIDAGPADAVTPGDVVRFDHGDRTFAIYRDDDGTLYATDGLCTHGKVHLADGFVSGQIIECPKHNGCFDFRTGQPKRKPITVALKTYSVRSDNGRIFLNPQPNG